MLQPSHSPSLHQIFPPLNTGSPRQDVHTHLSQLPQLARLDFEEHSVVGNLIVRIEPDLGSATEQEAEAKIVSVAYAERIFGNNADAVEFIRCVRLLAGVEARARDLQIIASHYYKEAKSRAAGEGQLSEATQSGYLRRYDRLVKKADQLNPHPPADKDDAGDSPKKKRPLITPQRRLVNRLLRRREEVLRFMSDLAVPFDNNGTERDLRMVKLQGRGARPPSKAG